MKKFVPALAFCLAAATALAGPATHLRNADPDLPDDHRWNPVMQGDTTAAGFTVTAVDDANNPVAGAHVTFRLSDVYACGSFGGKPSVEVVADANGVATSPPFTGSEVGDCAVIAFVPGGLPLVISTPVFTKPSVMIVGRGIANKSMEVEAGTDFDIEYALQVQLPSGLTGSIPNALMTFEVAGSGDGSGASFVTPANVATDANGAGRVTLQANASAGSYAVVMHVYGSMASMPIRQYVPGVNETRLRFVNPVINATGDQPFDIAVDAVTAGGDHRSNVGITLSFDCDQFLVCPTFTDTAYPHAVTDNGGRAHFTIMAGSYSGGYGVKAVMDGTAVSAYSEVRQMNADPGYYTRYQDMWWAGPAENGWGMSIVQYHGDQLFIVIFTYDSQGKPTWYVMPSGGWNGTAWSGALYRPHSSPWFLYDASKFQPGSAVGNAVVSFAGLDSARLDYTVDGLSGTKTVVRQPFGKATGSSGQLGTMWWAGSGDNGWGIAILEQVPKIFPIIYTYDDSGAPIWYVVPSGTWSGGTYSGRMYSTTGSRWAGQAYNPALLHVTDVGSISLQVTGPSTMWINTNMGTRSFAFGIFHEF